MGATMNPVRRNAFTLVEVLIVIMILGILAAVAVPRFASAGDDARTSATQSVLAGVRAAIASHRTAAAISGDDPYPTLSQLTDGSVLKFEVPTNPFTGIGGVQSVTASQASGRAVVNQDGAGWNYFVDNAASPPLAIFYANASSPTTASDGSGGMLTASDL